MPKIGDGRGGLTKPVFLDAVEAEIFLSCSFESTPKPAARKADSCRACAAVAAALLRFFHISSEMRFASCVPGVLLTIPAQTSAQDNVCATMGSGSRHSRSQSSASHSVGDLTPPRRICIGSIASTSQDKWPCIPPLLSFI